MMSKTVLIFGAGLSTGPLPVYLTQHGINVILASRTLANAQKMAQNLNNVETVEVDVTKDSHMEEVDKLIQRSDIVVSMLPYIYHPRVAELAIKHKKHFFTTSYVSDGIKELEKSAIEAGVILANELGVDPGMDHMSAMKIIDDAHNNGGKVNSFYSYCGALPSPAVNDNPLGYKFSWAPRGVLLASKNGAKFLKDGAEFEVKPGELYNHTQFFDVEGVGEIEGYANRNSLDYIPIFGIPEVKTFMRGTYRYKGWCSTLKKMIEIGFLDTEPIEGYENLTFAQLVARMINKPDSTNLKEDTRAFLSEPEDSDVISTFEWLGLFSDEKLPESSPLDSLCKVMMEKMAYKEGEYDMILMQHLFEIEYEDRIEKITSRLISFGDETGTALAKTVSYPVAICIRFLLEGKISMPPGINRPFAKDIYIPVLEELERLGYKFEEIKEVVSK